MIEFYIRFLIRMELSGMQNVIIVPVMTISMLILIFNVWVVEELIVY